MIDFTKLDYLKWGNLKQRSAYQVLVQYQIFEKLASFSPLLVGTIPIEIDTEESDLDIICEVSDEESFLETIRLRQLIPDYCRNTVKKTPNKGEQCIVVNFTLEEFPIEIFGQNKPSKEQRAYKHMLAEYMILKDKGEEFRQKIIALKKEGIKTEPAFGMLLNLDNPYEDLLEFKQ